jgi:DNA-directed RNA polymerase specialized sigma24 family protein
MSEGVKCGSTAERPEPTGMGSALSEEKLAQIFQARRDLFLAEVRSHLSPQLEKRINAEDVLQGAFIRMRARLNWLRESLTQPELEQKLARIVFEQIIDQIRSALGATRNADREVHFPDESIAQLAMKLYTTQTTPSGASQRKEVIALVRAALDQLGAIDKRIVLWRTDFNLAYKVIGQLMEPELAENTVNRRYIRALKKLGTLLPPANALI